MGGDELIRVVPGGDRALTQPRDRPVLSAVEIFQIDPEPLGDVQIPVVQGVAHHVSGQLLRVNEADGGIVAEYGKGGAAEILLRQLVRVIGACRFRFAVRIGRGAAVFRFRADTVGFRGITAVSAGREREEHGDEEQNGGELLGSLFHLGCLSVAWFIFHVGQSLTVGFLP